MALRQMNADPVGFLSPASRIQQDSDQRSRHSHNSLFDIQFTEITKATKPWQAQTNRRTEMSSNSERQSAVDFAERVRENQRRCRSNLKSHYDFIVCGSGSSGSVVARRLAENPDVSVLLLEAGDTDEVPSVTEAARWFENLGSERDWNFVDQPNPHLKGRSMPLGMGKVLGGGSSINVMGWARGHKNDWDFFASE